MEVVKKIIFYTDFTQEDLQNLRKSANNVDEDGFLIEAIEYSTDSLMPSHIKATYIKQYRPYINWIG